MVKESKKSEKSQAEIKNLIVSNFASAAVVLGCLGIAIMLVVQLYLQTDSLNTDPATKALSYFTESGLLTEDNLPPIEVARVVLEYDAQFLRTKRAQSLVSVRLFIQAISILAGISLLIMGSSFIFARIKTPNTSAEVETENGTTFKLDSYSPGLFLALLGSIIIVCTLVASVKSKNKTDDRPVFLDYPQGSYINFNREFFDSIPEEVRLSEKEKTIAAFKKEGIE